MISMDTIIIIVVSILVGVGLGMLLEDEVVTKQIIAHKAAYYTIDENDKYTFHWNQ